MQINSLFNCGFDYKKLIITGEWYKPMKEPLKPVTTGIDVGLARINGIKLVLFRESSVAATANYTVYRC